MTNLLILSEFSEILTLTPYVIQRLDATFIEAKCVKKSMNIYTVESRSNVFQGTHYKFLLE